MIKAIRNWFDLSAENAELRRNLQFQITTKREYYAELRKLQAQMELLENDRSFRGKYLFERGSRAKLNYWYGKLRQREDALRSDNQKLISYIEKKDKAIVKLQDMLTRFYEEAAEVLDYLDATKPIEVDNEHTINYDIAVSELLPDYFSIPHSDDGV